MNNKNLTIASIIIASGLIGGTFLFGGRNALKADQPQNTQEITLGEIESEHGHMTIMVFINGAPINFTQPRYMLKDKRAHFEDDDGTVIHKHATGVTLLYFLSTLGIDLAPTCITLDTGRQYCSSSFDGKTLRIVINGVEMADTSFYELRQGDKILVNYGEDDKDGLMFKFNNVPDVPAELL